MRRAAILTLVLVAAAPAAAEAAPTRLTVRAQALDAKFIGTHTGGMRITVRDAASGKVLAQGVTSGGTGDTKRLVTEPRTRNQTMAGAEDAGFTATLDIDRPTLVRVEANGPLGAAASAVTASTSLWMLPGRDVTGDGLVLTVPGLIIDPKVETPADGGLKVTAKLNLMCGCPIEPGGVWDAAHYKITARLMQGAREVAATELAYAGQSSTFAGAMPAAKPGAYTLQLVATDSSTINAGVVETKVTIPAAARRP